MVEPKKAYCIGCCKFIEVEDAAQLFKTGYFQVTTALGLCASCNENTQTDNEKVEVKL